MGAFLRTLVTAAWIVLLVLSASLTCVLVFHAGWFLWQEHPALLPILPAAGLLGGGAFAWWLKHRRPASGAEQLSAPHPGIRIHAIPVAGGAGLMVAVGYVLMFWFGAPSYHGLLAAIVATGVAAGVLRTLILRRPRERASLLGDALRRSGR